MRHLGIWICLTANFRLGHFSHKPVPSPLMSHCIFKGRENERIYYITLCNAFQKLTTVVSYLWHGEIAIPVWGQKAGGIPEGQWFSVHGGILELLFLTSVEAAAAAKGRPTNQRLITTSLLGSLLSWLLPKGAFHTLGGSFSYQLEQRRQFSRRLSVQVTLDCYKLTFKLLHTCMHSLFPPLPFH